MRPTRLNAKSFAANLMAYGASEVASKLSRLFVVFAVARALTPEQIGTAAAALAVAEIVKAMTENGVVYLMGLLTHEEADAVVEQVQKVYGVQKIVKIIEYID